MPTQNKKQKFIAMIMAQVKEDGPIAAIWDEADGSAGYIVKEDGTFMGLADYNEPEGHLKELNNTELALLASDALPYKEFEKEQYRFMTKAILNWLENRTSATCTADFIGSTPLSYFKETITLNQNVEYVDVDGTHRVLPQGSKLSAYSACSPSVPEKEWTMTTPHPTEKGYGLSIPLAYTDFPKPVFAPRNEYEPHPRCKM